MKKFNTASLTAASVLVVGIMGGIVGGAMVTGGGSDAPTPPAVSVEHIAEEATVEPTPSATPEATPEAEAPAVVDNETVTSPENAPKPAPKTEPAATSETDAPANTTAPAPVPVPKTVDPAPEPQPAVTPKPEKPIEEHPCTDGTKFFNGKTGIEYTCDGGKWVESKRYGGDPGDKAPGDDVGADPEVSNAGPDAD